MDINSVANSSIDIQSLLETPSKGTKNATTLKDTQKQTAEYAKKGEPMYMADMDSDEDGVVTLDEFREYCKSKGINSREMIKMSQMAASYRTMKAESDTINYISKLIPNISPKLKQADSNSAYQKQNENKLNNSTETNNNNKVAYNEYMNYCEKNATQHVLKSNTKAEEDEKGMLKIKNYGKAINSYKDNEEYSLNSVYEQFV